MSAAVSVGDDGGSRMVKKQAECGCDGGLRLNICAWCGAAWGGGGGGACESAKRHAKAACESQAACKASGMQMRRGDAGKRARTLKPPLREIEIPKFGVFWPKFFLS